MVQNKPYRVWRERRKDSPWKSIQAPENVVLRFAQDNAWGYTRILGELKKLGITVSRSTIVILREAGLDPNPQRGRGTWSDFVKRHAQSLWACDFLQRKIWTVCGPAHYFLLFFIHIGSRRVHLAGITAQPTVEWVAQKARDMALIRRVWILSCGATFLKRSFVPLPTRGEPSCSVPTCCMKWSACRTT
jgi:hypothetical protein